MTDVPELEPCWYCVGSGRIDQKGMNYICPRCGGVGRTVRVKLDVRYPLTAEDDLTVAQRECNRLRWLLNRFYREMGGHPGRPLMCKCLSLSDADRPCIACQVAGEVARFGECEGGAIGGDDD